MQKFGKINELNTFNPNISAPAKTFCLTGLNLTYGLHFNFNTGLFLKTLDTIALAGGGGAK